MKSPMTILNVKAHIGKTITVGGVRAKSISLTESNQKRIITG